MSASILIMIGVFFCSFSSQVFFLSLEFHVARSRHLDFVWAGVCRRHLSHNWCVQWGVAHGVCPFVFYIVFVYFFVFNKQILSICTGKGACLACVWLV